MNKTIVLMGMTSSGKDTAIKYISENYDIPIAVSYSTRPRRPNETDGIEYHFVSDEEFDKLPQIIPPRIYNTFQDNKPAVWKYLTNPNVAGRVVILDKKGAELLCEALGRENVIVIYIKSSLENIEKRLIIRNDSEMERNRRIIDDTKVFKGAEQFADYTIENNSTLWQFYKKIDKIMLDK